MTMTNATKALENKIKQALDQTVMDFNRDLLRAWPVDTGYSRRGFALSHYNTRSEYKWSISSKVSYSPILWEGRVGNKGSFQMPDGADPILQRAIALLRTRL